MTDMMEMLAVGRTAPGSATWAHCGLPAARLPVMSSLAESVGLAETARQITTVAVRGAAARLQARASVGRCSTAGRRAWSTAPLRLTPAAAGLAGAGGGGGGNPPGGGVGGGGGGGRPGWRGGRRAWSTAPLRLTPAAAGLAGPAVRVRAIAMAARVERAATAAQVLAGWTGRATSPTAPSPGTGATAVRAGSGRPAGLAKTPNRRTPTSLPFH